MPRLGRITIERGCIVECNAHFGLVTFRADKGVDPGAQPFKRWLLGVLDAAQQLCRLAPFIALEPKEDRRFVGEILVQRPDADPGLLLDGAKALYPAILSLVESRLRPGAFIVADNADYSPDYLAHVRAPANGYMSTPLAEDVELSIRIS
jgi:hypothetical protein